MENTGTLTNKRHALAVQKRLRDFYIPEITSITYEGQYVEAPQPVPWYPDQLAWFMTTPKNVIRRFPPFASFQKFLVAETDVGNISRQEVVSMIPPLLMDIKPGMTVLDLCAAPGSKSAQLIEMIHAGEEERVSALKATDLGNALDKYEDDGRSTGLLIANDVDYKRAHMLVHQIKRLSSPNIIVTNHDATIFPSIKLPSVQSQDGKPVSNRYLKFDRILADVPCSGDGTTRKNLEVWTKWTPSNGLGLHLTQVRILVRALQMLKVGGRVVYSTCSMNPVEDEAVLAAAIDRCGGSSQIQILETKDYLPGLKRYPGLTKWKVMDKVGRMWNNYEEVLSQKGSFGDDGLSRLYEGMFPPKEDLPLERCMRVYAHQQDTGAFFIAILEKKSEIKVRTEDKKPVTTLAANSGSRTLATTVNGEVETEEDGPMEHNQTPAKRKRDVDDIDNAEIKRIKTDNEEDIKTAFEDFKSNGTTLDSHDLNMNGSMPDGPKQDSSKSQPETYKMKRKTRDQPFEEPFKYLDSGIAELEWIRKFYTISNRFPRDRFMVRNAQSTASKNIYYTTELAKMILQENEGKGMKFVHSGIKMFVKQDVPKPEICPWRIQTDGLTILEPWVGKDRVIKLTKKETLRKLLIEMFPKFDGDDWKQLGEIGEQVRDISMGCCVLVVEPSSEVDGLSERMIFPLWKSLHSLNLMLPKEDRKAMLLRLFNDNTPLVNLQSKDPTPKTQTGHDIDDALVQQDRNSSSEPETKVENDLDGLDEFSQHDGQEGVSMRPQP
jgi:multisite-specific tRNA:(cytosine-C5)-methyltransferase